MLDAALLPAFRESLLSGKYNLLLGAGVSLTSRNRAGLLLRSTEQLRLDLCKATGAHPTAALPRVYGLLQPDQVRTEIVNRYSGCTPGPELGPLKRYVWKRIFTFNVDDVIESLYERDAQQDLISLNFDSSFEPDTDKSELQCIHLHGHVARPGSGFVFSHNEYVRFMRGINPWMLMLSQLLATDAFIIAGTSLNEIDLEYYLSHRTDGTPRKSRGPALLIEPYPDAATEADCRRYGLVLVRATFGEFLAWVVSEMPSPPTVRDLTVPSLKGIFSEDLPPKDLLRFFSDFELVSGANVPKATVPSPYLYGGDPTWQEVAQHLDIERKENQLALDWARAWLSGARSADRLLLVSEDAATGKSTLLKRVGHDLAASGVTVFSVRTLSRIDVDTSLSCFASVSTPFVILVDSFASHAQQIRDLLAAKKPGQLFAVIAAERRYRQDFVDVIFSETPPKILPLAEPDEAVLQQLVEQYNRFGLLADPLITKDRKRVLSLKGDPIAVAVCRILNDFRPFDRVVDSLWDEADSVHADLYLACALAHWCHQAGLRYSILQAIAGPTRSLDGLVGGRLPLALSVNSIDEDFVLPQSPVVAERLLQRIARSDREKLFEAFTSLANSIAPRVNRKAIMEQSPEARLAGRLFDADKVVKPFLGAQAEEFYIAVKPSWEWNSRYWEQRALLVMERDIRTATQYARHAVAILRHPFTLTTLGKVLFRSLDTVSDGTERTKVFEEAFAVLNQAIALEEQNARVTVHPFSTLLGATSKFLENGGSITLEQRDTLAQLMEEARYRFPGDPGAAAAVARLDPLL